MPDPVTTTQRGTNSANLYIDINKQGAGTLSGKNVDQKLIDGKVERLLTFEEGMHTEILPASESTLQTAGQIHASWVKCQILRTQPSVYVQSCFFQRTSIPTITVYRADIINKKLTVTEQIDFKDCYITRIYNSVETLKGENMYALLFWLRFNQRQDTLIDFDQNGQPSGQQVSYIDFTTFGVEPQGGGGGGGGEGGNTPL